MGDNYFGGASQFAGGGFMPSPALGTDNAYGGGGGQKRSGGGAKREETIRAVTLKQVLHDCRTEEEDTFTLDNAPVTNISVVGRIIDVQENATRITYKIHDNTGVLDMVMHMPAGDEEELFQARKRELVHNTYVRAYGTLRRFNGQISMTAYNIRPIQDFNELAFHNLQVIFQHLHLLRGPAPSAAPAGPAGPAAYGAPQANAHVMGGQGMGMGMGGGMQATPGPRSGDLNTDVLNVYNNPANRDVSGLNLAAVEQQLRNQGMHYTGPQIKSAVEFLVNEGHLYSTIDENHFKSCSS